MRVYNVMCITIASEVKGGGEEVLCWCSFSL